MISRECILNHSEYDVSQVLADTEEIRKYIPQRFEMEQLTAVVYEDIDAGICVGYKQTSEDDFWCRGHMPGFPLMPGVLMCEAAAQMATYFTQKFDLMGVEMIGFGGMNDVRFRGMVRPGDRLVIMARLTRIRRGAMIVCNFQCYVEEQLVCEGEIKGIPLAVASKAEAAQ